MELKLLKDMDESELRNYMQALSEAITGSLPDDAVGFVLLVACDDGIMQYSSSLDREGTIGSLREFLSKFEARETTER